jgi:hypothetical protein
MVYKPNVEILAEKLAACIELVHPDIERSVDRIELAKDLMKDSQ